MRYRLKITIHDDSGVYDLNYDDMTREMINSAIDLAINRGPYQLEIEIKKL